MTETHRLLIALISMSLYALWVAVLFYKTRKHAAHQVAKNQTLIVYASQTGTAERVARAKAAGLAKNEATSVVSMASLKLTSLSDVSKVIFVVSTYGEGEPPDAGRKFSHALKRAMANKPALLSHLSFEVVGLGDRQYKAFCQFALSLYDSIIELGGQALSPVVTLDAGKGEHLSVLQSLPEYTAHPTLSVALHKRTRLNTAKSAIGDLVEGTNGLYALSFNIMDNVANNNGKPDNAWEAGDVLEVFVPNTDSGISGDKRSANEVISRSYTIASVPQEQDIKLVVRQLVKDSGELGIGSGLLTHSLPLNQSIQAQIRVNESATINNTQCPLLLIAAGSGIAGVRAQLAKRALVKSAGPVWIFFGERHPQFDDVLDKTLSPFHQAACIHKKSLIFSRVDDGGYVQSLLHDHAEEVRDFLGHNGQIYVCGHFEGMGQGVDAVLKHILGIEQYDALLDERRYHRDLY